MKILTKRSPSVPPHVRYGQNHHDDVGDCQHHGGHEDQGKRGDDGTDDSSNHADQRHTNRPCVRTIGTLLSTHLCSSNVTTHVMPMPPRTFMRIDTVIQWGWRNASNSMAIRFVNDSQNAPVS